jgi:hypothetical protein
MACPLCRRRKGKRHCPAKGESICAACCGAKRRVEIDCPEDCAYLTGAHAGSWQGRVTEHERDMRRLGPYVSHLEDEAARLVFLALTGIGALGARDPALDDARVVAALETLRKTSQTRETGLVYEHRAENPHVQAVVEELDALLKAPLSTADGDSDDAGRTARPAEVAATLDAIGTAIAATLAEQAGPRAFVETAGRLAARFGSPVVKPEPEAPLIVRP